MPDQDRDNQELLAELEELRVRLEEAEETLRAITLSFGVATFPEHGDNPDAVLNAADAAMYRAKQEGRDQVVIAGGNSA